MAKNVQPPFQYRDEIAALKAKGPERLYLFYGPEDYLRERYLDELKALCVPEDDDFSYKRIDGADMDLNTLAEAVNAMPFFSQRTLVEVRGYDINKCRDADAETLKEILSDIPDYCTVVFVIASSYELDGRLTAVKFLKKVGHAIEFTEPSGNALFSWASIRFKALGKQIEQADAEHLFFLSGRRMNTLIPEIEKAAAHAVGDYVTKEDIDATASHIPEADVFRMAELLSQKKADQAASVLSDLLADKDNHPIYITALIGMQMRRIYSVKVGVGKGLQRGKVKELAGVNYDSYFENYASAAKQYSLDALSAIVSLCAEYDFRMKSTGADPYFLIRELFARIAAEV